MPQRLFAALVVLFAIAGCGGGGGGSSAPGPFADVAGSYTTTVQTVSGNYVGHASPGDARAASIDGNGLLQTTDNTGAPLSYQMNDGGSGVLFSNPRILGGGFTESLHTTRPITSGTLTMFNSTGTQVGQITYTVVRLSGAG